MNFNIDKDYAGSAGSLLRKLYYDNYLFDSGISTKSNLSNILKDHDELFDLSIFKNFNIDKYAEPDHETIRLFKIFISELEITYGCIKPLEQLKNELIKQTELQDNKEIILFNLISIIKTERKREKRIKLGKLYKKLTDKNHKLLETMIEKQNQSSQQLGFDNYSDQTCKLNLINITQIEHQCAEFLNDTEYIYKDLIKWQLKNKLDIKIEDAAHEDLLLLFNSYELKDYFKQTSLIKLSTGFLDELGMPLSDSISIDLVNRANKNSKAKTYPVEIPGSVLISIYRIKTVEDYESILGEICKSLLFSSIDIDQTFENKRLIDPTVLQIFKILFQDFIFEQKWLERYLRIDTDKNFTELLNLKRLADIRSLCVNVLIYRTIYESNNLYDSLSGISHLYLSNVHVKPNENIILFDLVFNHINPYTNFLALQHESYLKEVLKNRFDEQWWRDIQAGNQMIKWWNLCSDLSTTRLQEDAGIANLDNTELVKRFEQVF